MSELFERQYTHDPVSENHGKSLIDRVTKLTTAVKSLTIALYLGGDTPCEKPFHRNLTNQSFSNTNEAVQAYLRGELTVVDLHAVIEVLNS